MTARVIGGYMENLEFDYVNYRSEVSRRKVIVHNISYGTCEPWHPDPQWIMYALDLEKNEFRYFAMKDMTNVK